MWGVPRYRIRSHLEGRRRREKADLLKKRAPKLKVKRVPAEVRIQEGFASHEGSIRARVILNDLAPSGLILSTAQPLYPGQRISLTLSYPRQFFIRAVVMACNTVTFGEHVITEQSYNYRVLVKFIFDGDSEREIVRDYCEREVRRFVQTF